ncbi:sensor domain-containing diguanylate cyclase [Synechococcus sp. CCY9201]|uniref:sensor domain-containing diguanylate cyclase n=1 Tax=Synechococcus sp. CCY9201 TaxID=174697 RepID=UPI002B1F0601|nr:sensor domain-containing diguanylate cyclase [Synechococcus sp. CCY9201]MEA5474256.1 sensor domain-containing diguanylate cyclase [Synechococcus sp. CCY9201]
MPSQQQLLEVIRIQGEIAKQGFNLAAVMQLVVEEIPALLDADGAVIELAEGDAMVYRAVSGMAAHELGLRLSIEHSLSGLCVRTGETLICTDTHDDPRVDRAACELLGLRSMVVVPLMHHDACVGVLKAMARQPDGFGGPAIYLLGLLSQAIAAAMFFATTYSQNDLYHLATHDPMTDLANRALFMERLRTLIEAHQQRRHSVAVLMIDMDGLKGVNDTHGHRAGDCIIQACAQRLASAVGERGLVARLGGDEFAAVLPQFSTIADLECITAVIHEAMEPPVVFEQLALPLAVSIGGALLPYDSTELDQLLALADERMYACKRERQRFRTRM